MSRIRTIKPELAFDEELAGLSLEAQKFFILLWTHCDREGRTDDFPSKLRALIFPYHPDIDAEAILAELSPKFVIRYRSAGKKYLQVRTFLEHQRPNNKEGPSTIPAPSKNDLRLNLAFSNLRQLKQDKAYKGTGKEGKGRERTIEPTAKKREPTPVQSIVEAYKVAKNIDQKDKGWDRQNFGRYSKAAKGLLECFKGDLETAAAYLFSQKADFDEKGISWTLETINRHAWDNKGKWSENGSKNSEVDADRVLDGRSRSKRITSAGELASETIRAIEYREMEGTGNGVLDEPFMD